MEYGFEVSYIIPSEFENKARREKSVDDFYDWFLEHGTVCWNPYKKRNTMETQYNKGNKAAWFSIYHEKLIFFIDEVEL